MNIFKMIGAYSRLIFLVLALSSVASGYCPRENIHRMELCNYRILCIGNVRSISLPDECRGSVNYPVNVDLTLRNAAERFDDHIENEREFLDAVTTFGVTAHWPQTSLSFLAYMPKLRNLVLTDNSMHKIDGAPFYRLKYLQHLDLSRNFLVDIENLFQFEEQANGLKQLFLAHNAIEVIPVDAFSQLMFLKELDLSNNLISDLYEEPFYNLTNLEILRLDNNKIKDLNGAVNKLINLKHLYLRGNHIENIDEPSLHIIHHLQTFDVSKNQLEKLRPIMFLKHRQHFDGVCRIILSENQITSIPNGTSRALAARYTRHLGHNIEFATEVDLSKNLISNIEFNAFQSIVKMTRLDLSNNRLIDFVLNPLDFKDVTYLNLSSNYLVNLNYDSFSSMPNLQNLDLSHNRLNYIPAETFVTNYNLRFVNMTFNEFNVIESLHIKMFHMNGGVLDFSNNDLSEFAIPAGEAFRLTVLVLNSNQIADAVFINLKYQNQLRTLEMRNNSIQQLNNTSLRLPLSLSYLDLSENEIERIYPTAFYRLTHLKSLYLANNELKKIEYGAFQGLAGLSTLDLSFNKIAHLDSKFLTDLKSLSVLYLKSNGLYFLDSKGWLGHKVDLVVYLDDNRLNCEWLGQALKDFNNGYSKMRPTVRQFLRSSSKNSVEGIPCITDEIEKQVDLRSKYTLADERLLVINQQILESVREQTSFLRSFMNQFNLVKAVNTSSNV